jgi:hypothetical protein
MSIEFNSLPFCVFVLVVPMGIQVRFSWMDPNQTSPYHQLDESRREFRLFRLLDSPSDRIQCELGSLSLLDNDLPPWKALSYRWGENEPEFVVYLGNHPMPVRTNLHAFITQMVAEERRDWFFIDALCINQDSESEKSSQVKQMGEIYRRAEGVVTWIVYEPFCSEVKEEEGYYDPVNDSDDIPSMSRPQLERAVLENSYWSRVWILQEVLLAKNLTIRIGSAEVDWLNLIPARFGLTIFDRRGLPTKNATIEVRGLVRRICTGYAD